MIARARIRATIYIVLIFLCGMLAGTVATTAWKNWGGSTRAASRPRSAQHTVAKLTRELNLNPDQTRQLNEILDETHRQYRDREDEMQSIREQGRDRIRKILNDEQRPKYEQMLAKNEAGRKRPKR